MNGIGLDCGNATLKLVLLSPEGTFLWEKTASHYGAVVQSARRLLGELLAADPGACGCPVVITGNAGDRLKAGCNALAVLGEIPAIHLGVRLLAPEARSAIEIGSQSARFLTGLDQNTPPRFAVNEHCAGGTGSFFEDQMSRLGLKLEDYSRLVGQARSIPRLSGRCAVFAKTDIIHRQQEGVPTPDILLGLCYAMVRNYKAVIVRGLPVEKPVALCGGIGHNQGVIQAVREVFGLSEAELILPEKFPYAGAVGAAEAAMETATCSMGELLASLCGGALEGGNQMCRQPALRVLPGTLPSVPAATGTIPPDGCVLGIDVGSTSTNLVLVDLKGELLDAQYLRTRGDAKNAVREGLARGCGEFYIYGGTGGVRLDHTLANLQTLAFLRRHGARGYLYDRDFVYTVLENETLTLRRQVEWGLVSLFAMSGTQQDVTLEGLQYPLAHADVTGDFPIGVSNHFIADTARITCGSGLLLVGWQLPPLTETPADRSQAAPPAR